MDGADFLNRMGSLVMCKLSDFIPLKTREIINYILSMFLTLG